MCRNRLPYCDCPLTTVLHRGGLEAHALSLAEETPLVLGDVELWSLSCLKIALWQVETAQWGDVLGVCQPVKEAGAGEDEVAVTPFATARNPAGHLPLSANYFIMIRVDLQLDSVPQQKPSYADAT